MAAFFQNLLITKISSIQNILHTFNSTTLNASKRNLNLLALNLHYGYLRVFYRKSIAFKIYLTYMIFQYDIKFL